MLGSESGDILDHIKEKEELEKVNTEIKSRNITIVNIQNEIKKQNLDFENACWEIKLKYDKIFPSAIVGTRGSKKAFSRKCLEQYQSQTNIVV